MNDEDNQGRERDLRERIVSLIRANEQARKTPIAGEELQKVDAAASRLGQMLKAAAEADRQTLRSAAARLDQLLVDIRAGEDVSSRIKRRQDWQQRERKE